jgi:hypothetical protein
MLQGLLMIMFPEHFGLAVFGASAGVAGIFAIFALLEREAEVRLYFVLPVRAMTLLWVFAGISLFFTLVPSGATAHAAHLGGILAGLAWVKSGWHHDYITLPWERWFSGWRRWSPLQSRQRKRELVRAASMRSRPWRKTPLPAEEVELPPDEFISREVDPILDKISQHGIHSLTEQERRILDAARKRMAKR